MLWGPLPWEQCGGILSVAESSTLGAGQPAFGVSQCDPDGPDERFHAGLHELAFVLTRQSNSTLEAEGNPRACAFV